MTIETLLTELTVAIRELTAAVTAQPMTVAGNAQTPSTEGVKRSPGRPRKNVETAPSTPTAEAAEDAAPEQKEQPSAQDVPQVQVTETTRYFKDTTTGKGMILEKGWPIPSMERLVEIDEEQHKALEAPKVTPVVSVDTMRAKVLNARDELIKRTVASGKTPDEAKTLAMSACKDMIATVGGAAKLDEVAKDKILAVIQKAERLLADKGALAFDIPTATPEEEDF